MYNTSMPIIDKIFNYKILIAINLLIVFAAEFAGGGEFFFMTGAIHIVALLFIVLTVSRIFFHYYTFDPIFEKFVHMAIAASLVFSASHIFEFISMRFFYLYNDAIFANVVNFYIAAFALIIIGAESFLSTISHRSLLKAVMWLAISIAGILTVLFFYNNELISLEPDSMAPFAYSAALLVVGLSGIRIILRVKKIAPISGAFSNYLAASLILIIFSTLPYVFYEFLEESAYHIEEHQIIYASHFLFFAASSLLFLAFTKLSWGGIYAEVREMKNGNHFK